MVQLRKANVKDFQVYKKLYEDREFWYQWLYYYPIIKADESKESDFEEWGLEDIIEEYQNYTEEKFRKDLKTSRIFMIEKGGKILGSVRTFYCGNGTYIAVRLPNPSLNSLGIFFCGHFVVQSPQPVQTLSSILLALSLILASKLPINPLNDSSSA